MEPKKTHPKTTAKRTVSAPENNPRGWDQSHGTYISGRAALDGVDAAAVAMERKWGCDRLRLLVSHELREKFDRQRYKLAAAVHNGELIDVQRESSRMLLAWSALDAVAEKAGAKPIDPLVWEVTLEDGSVAAIVHDTAEAHAVIAQGREVAIYTLDEIGRMISSYPSVMKAKKLWPGATVTRTNKTIGDPLDVIRHATSFDDPLDDLWKPEAV